jgi:hypothetical protein
MSTPETGPAPGAATSEEEAKKLAVQESKAAFGVSSEPKPAEGDPAKKGTNTDDEKKGDPGTKPQGEPGPGASEEKPGEEENLFAGKFKTVPALETGYSEAHRHIVKLQEENKKTKDEHAKEIEELKHKLAEIEKSAGKPSGKSLEDTVAHLKKTYPELADKIETLRDTLGDTEFETIITLQNLGIDDLRTRIEQQDKKDEKQVAEEEHQKAVTAWNTANPEADEPEIKAEMNRLMELVKQNPKGSPQDIELSMDLLFLAAKGSLLPMMVDKLVMENIEKMSDPEKAKKLRAGLVAGATPGGPGEPGKDRYAEGRDKFGVKKREF